jgi:arylsulfatase A-like enzyme
VLHVPLIFWAPSMLAPPRRVPGPASLADLMPTVLDVVGVPAPPNLDGRSLLAPQPTGTSARVVYAET